MEGRAPEAERDKKPCGRSGDGGIKSFIANFGRGPLAGQRQTFKSARHHCCAGGRLDWFIPVPPEERQRASGSCSTPGCRHLLHRAVKGRHPARNILSDSGVRHARDAEFAHRCSARSRWSVACPRSTVLQGALGATYMTENRLWPGRISTCVTLADQEVNSPSEDVIVKGRFLGAKQPQENSTSTSSHLPNVYRLA